MQMHASSDTPTCPGEPPPQSNEEEAPVTEELRRLLFEGVSDKLEDPADEKQDKRDPPKAADKGCDQEEREGASDERNANRMAGPVGWMLMTLLVLRDPRLDGLVAQHGSIPFACGLRRWQVGAYTREQMLQWRFFLSTYQ
jgi:hypothetical protein